MSLLNDALRKKRTASQPRSAVRQNLQQQPLYGKKRRYRRLAVAAASGMALTCGLLFWYFYSSSKANPSSFQATVAIDQTVDTTLIAAKPAELTVPMVELAPEHPPVAIDRPVQQPAADVDISAPLRYSATKTPPKQFIEQAAVPSNDKRSAKRKQTTRPPLTRTMSENAHTSQKVPLKPVARRPKVSHLYEKARRYHRQARLDDAVNMYLEILKIDSRHADTRFNLISIYLQTGAFDEAYPMALELYQQTPENPAVILNLAVACIGRGDAEKGLGLLNRAEQRPEAPLFEIYFHQGIANRHLGQLAAAIACYRKAEQLNASDPRLLFNLAVARDQQQHYAEAIRYYNKYIKTLENENPTIRRRIERRMRELQSELSKPATGKDTPQ